MLQHLTLLALASIQKDVMKAAYQTSGCCPLLQNHNICNIVHVEGGPQSGFTCAQAKELYCSAVNGLVEFEDCELCYGEHDADSGCAASPVAASPPPVAASPPPVAASPPPAAASPPPAAASPPPAAASPPPAGDGADECKDADELSPPVFFTGSAIDAYYSAKTCADMKEKDTTGDYAGFGWGDPCLKTVAQVAQDKSVGGTSVAPVGYEDKQFSELCPKTCEACTGRRR